MPRRAIVETHEEGETLALGEAIAEALLPGSFLGLTGTLGAGKTLLVRGICQGLGVDPREVTSPTYALVHTYRGRLPVYHLDLYRVAHAEEVEATGVLDLAGEGVALVEWVERAAEILPPDRIWITIEVLSGDRRRLRVDDASHGSPVAALAEAWDQARGRMSQ